MIPPRGFQTEKYPLLHRLEYGFGLSLGDDKENTVLAPIVMHSNEMDVAADTIQVNPHNTGFEEDTGPLCRSMSIIDRLRISMKFSMSSNCGIAHHESGTSTNEVFSGDDIPAFKFLWRPIWNVFPEKLDAADDDTGTSVATILALTKDATFEDVVPLTTNKLNTSAAGSHRVQPMSTVNAVQVFGDYNLTTNTAMEDHVWDENLFQNALRRYINKGALRSCVGRMRHVTLTRDRPYQNVYLDKLVPRAVRRIMPYGFFGIQVHLPLDSDDEQLFMDDNGNSSVNHLGVKIIANYHEWNVEHDQDRSA